MLAKAMQRNIHVSPKKAKLCCRLIRNKPVNEALRILENNPNKTSRYLFKLLMSACANAVNNHAMSGKNLYVYRSLSHQGKILKRTMPRARGRADLMRKRFSHLEVWVSDDAMEDKKRNEFLLRPKAHQKKYMNRSSEKGAVEIMPKLISKKQKESSGK